MHNELSAKQQLMQLISGNWISQSVYAAAKLNIADHLFLGPKTADELAEQVGCHAGALYRMLRALVSVGVFEAREGKRFALTAISDCLRSDSDYSGRSSSIMWDSRSLITWLIITNMRVFLTLQWLVG
jgi:hypothetical protein